MPERKSHAPGSFCWPEVAVADAGRAKGFYSEALGWDMQDVPGGFYTLAMRKGKAVAGLYGLSDAQKAQKVPPHWMSYVRVASADESAKKAGDLGGKVLAPAFDVPTVGRMAVVEDPTGACLALWEARGMEGSALVDEPGAPCWYELMTPDPEKARAFYTALFGWTVTISPMPTVSGGKYTEFHNGKSAAAGMMPTPPELLGKVPPHWLPYIAVEDCDATARAWAAAGGRAEVPPTDIPGIGRFAVLTAPDGATLGVIRMGK